MFRKIFAFIFLVLVADIAVFAFLQLQKERCGLKTARSCLCYEIAYSEGAKILADVVDLERKSAEDGTSCDTGSMVIKGFELMLAEKKPEPQTFSAPTPYLRWNKQQNFLKLRRIACSSLSNPQYLAVWGGNDPEKAQRYLQNALSEPDPVIAAEMLKSGCYVFENDERMLQGYSIVKEKLPPEVSGELDSTWHKLFRVRAVFAFIILPALLLLLLIFFFRKGKGWLTLVILATVAVISYGLASNAQFRYEKKMYPMTPLMDTIPLQDGRQIGTAEKLALLMPDAVLLHPGDELKSIPGADREMLIRWIRCLEEAGTLKRSPHFFESPDLIFTVTPEQTLYVVRRDNQAPVAIFSIPEDLRKFCFSGSDTHR